MPIVYRTIGDVNLAAIEVAAKELGLPRPQPFGKQKVQVFVPRIMWNQIEREFIAHGGTASMLEKREGAALFQIPDSVLVLV